MFKRKNRDNKKTIRFRPDYDREDLFSRISKLAKYEPKQRPAVGGRRRGGYKNKRLDVEFSDAMLQLERGESGVDEAIRIFREIINKDVNCEYDPRSRKSLKRYSAEMLERACVEFERLKGEYEAKRRDISQKD